MFYHLNYYHGVKRQQAVLQTIPLAVALILSCCLFAFKACRHAMLVAVHSDEGGDFKAAGLKPSHPATQIM